uniref:Uncharacterized protein n=2 Tax=Vitis vinifera TaxID=29760 RepID=F6GY56_VITVI
MKRAKVGAYCPSPAPTLVVLVVLLVGSVQFIQCHNVDDYNEFDNPELLLLFTQLGYGKISNMTTMLSVEFQKRSNFCFKDPDADWNQAFIFHLIWISWLLASRKLNRYYPIIVHICRNKVLLQ